MNELMDLARYGVDIIIFFLCNSTASSLEDGKLILKINEDYESISMNYPYMQLYTYEYIFWILSSCVYFNVSEKVSKGHKTCAFEI